MAKHKDRKAFQEMTTEIKQRRKTAHAAQTVNYEREKLSWQINLIDYDDQWGWDNLPNVAKLKAILAKLAQFETMTWAEILSTGSHPIMVTDISVAARQRLGELHLDEVEELFSLRLSARERIWGIRDRHRFKVLWYDPDHTVYPVEKKHT